MPQGFSFDGDVAAYAALKKAVLKKEAEKPEYAQQQDRKKSIGEKVANFIFNGGRPEKLEEWQEHRGPSGDFR